MTDKQNEAERMREGYADQQNAQERGGKTSAGGAGSTSTPGNTRTGGETTSDDRDRTTEKTPRNDR